MAYSFQQIEQLWIAAGGDPHQARTAAAIAMAESAGNPASVNHNTNGSIDRGVWQINSVHGAQSTLDPLANARAAVAISKNGADWSPWVTYNTGAYLHFLGADAAGGQAETVGFPGIPAIPGLPNIPGIPGAGSGTDLGTGFGLLPFDLTPGKGGLSIPTPGGVLSGITQPFTQTANALIDIANVSATIIKLITDVHFWIRVGEGIAGLILLHMGLRTVTGIDLAGSAVKKGTKAAGTAAGVAGTVAAVAPK